MALATWGRSSRCFWFMCVLGLASLLLPAYGSSNPWRVLAVGFFLAGGTTLFESVVGFLFGVPRHSTKNQRTSSYTPNTNLERISDWLTKVLIGASLVQASEVIASFKSLAWHVGPEFGKPPGGPTIAGALIIHYLLVGFFQGFLLAYLWLPRGFARTFRAQQTRAGTPREAQPNSALHETEPSLRSCPASER